MFTTEKIAVLAPIAERQRGDGREGERGVLADRAQGVAQVLEKRIHDGSTSVVEGTDFVEGLRPRFAAFGPGTAIDTAAPR